MKKDAKIYIGKKIISSINDVEKTEQLHVGNEIKTFCHTVYKNKLKMD